MTEQEQMIIDLLQSDELDIRLKNLNHTLSLMWHNNEWIVKNTQTGKTVMITSDLVTALKWLKGV